MKTPEEFVLEKYQWMDIEDKQQLEIDIRARDAEWQANDALREAAQEAIHFLQTKKTMLPGVRGQIIGNEMLSLRATGSEFTAISDKLRAALASATARTVPMAMLSQIAIAAVHYELNRDRPWSQDDLREIAERHGYKVEG